MININKNKGVSIIIPTRNEEKIVIENLAIIHSHLKNKLSIEIFELIVSDYSSDNTEQILKSLIADKNEIRYYNTINKGIGAGLKLGIKKSNYNIIVFYPIDLAYDIQSIARMIEKIEQGYDIVFGSRRCVGATEKKPLNRRILSDIYSLLLKIILKVKIKDTQGVFALKKSKIDYFDDMKSDDGFFQTELAIYGEINKSKIIEIPVNQIEPENRQTKANQFVLGYFMLKKLIKTYFKIKRI